MSATTKARSPAPAALPAPTADLEQARRDILDYGVAIVPDVLSGETLKRARDALYRAADDDRARGREQKFGLDYGHDETNRRVWNVLSRDPVFEDLVQHPAALQLVKSVLGWPCLLGNISANITGPGGGEMVLHADQIFVPEPWPAEPQGANVAWCLDDFTEANGATRSHVACNMERSPSRLRNCLGKASRDSGHSRVPEPPERMTGIMQALSASADEETRKFSCPGKRGRPCC